MLLGDCDFTMYLDIRFDFPCDIQTQSLKKILVQVHVKKA